MLLAAYAYREGICSQIILSSALYTEKRMLEVHYLSSRHTTADTTVYSALVEELANHNPGCRSKTTIRRPRQATVPLNLALVRLNLKSSVQV